MRLYQDEETIYADFNADVYNDLIEYQFNNIVELMSGLGTVESIQEKVLLKGPGAMLECEGVSSKVFL